MDMFCKDRTKLIFIVLLLVSNVFAFNTIAAGDTEAVDPFSAALINPLGSSLDLRSIICEVLGGIGIGCNDEDESSESAQVLGASVVVTGISYNGSSLARVSGDMNTIYYITQKGLIREIPNKKIFDSYGNREENVVEITRAKFDSYPRNEFIFLESQDSNRSVFYIDNNTKSYVAPEALLRMQVQDYQIAPVNFVELQYYAPINPIIN